MYGAWQVWGLSKQASEGNKNDAHTVGGYIWSSVLLIGPYLGAQWPGERRSSSASWSPCSGFSSLHWKLPDPSILLLCACSHNDCYAIVMSLLPVSFLQNISLLSFNFVADGPF